MKKYSYAASLVWVFFLPTLYIWSALQIMVPLVQMIIFLTFITVVGSFYDVWAARHGVRDTHWIWSFNKSNTMGVWFRDLPSRSICFTH